MTLLQLGDHPENGIDPRLVAAVAAAQRGDADRFRQEVKALDELGWDEVEGPAGMAFVAALAARLGDTPNVGDIVNLAQAVHPKTRAVLNASVYDVEFLIRGQAGATQLGRTFPRNVAVAMQLAIIGALTETGPVTLGLPAFDRS